MNTFVVIVAFCVSLPPSQEVCTPVYARETQAPSEEVCNAILGRALVSQFQGTPERPHVGVACVLKGKDS